MFNNNAPQWTLISLGLLVFILAGIASVIVLSLIPIYLPSKQVTIKHSNSIDCSIEKEKAVYDYIVIGSGPGGTTIATRLALNNFQVLLVEAGPDYDGSDTRIPGFWAQAQLNSNITTKFYPYLYTKNEQIKIEYPRGITLGGSSHINALVAMIAHPSEWNSIAQLTNDNDWNSNNIINNYQKLVINCTYCNNGNNPNGWLNVSLTPYKNSSLNLNETNSTLNNLLENLSLNFPFNENINANNTYDSYFNIPLSAGRDNPIRASTYRRIENIQQIRSSNLHVWTNTFVTKLIIDFQTKQTCGIEYINGENLYNSNKTSSEFVDKSKIYVKREIILSGGQWMSPQLLQLSGIGDKNLLKQFNIDLIEDLPGVGNNLQEHPEISYIIKLKSNKNFYGFNNTACTYNRTAYDPCLIDYINRSPTNIYSTNNNLIQVLRSTQPNLLNTPDSTFLFIPQKFVGIRENWLNIASQNPTGTHVTVDIELGRPDNNFGKVYIQSKNAFDQPLIELNHFNNSNQSIDIKRFIENIRYLREFFFNSSFSQYIDSEVSPGSNLITDEQLTEFIRTSVWGHHACCTNKMGNIKNDPLAVVNSKGQVKGIQNLRICDISIFPKVPGYFPMVPIATACEKIANDIIQYAKTQ